MASLSGSSETLAAWPGELRTPKKALWSRACQLRLISSSRLARHHLRTAASRRSCRLAFWKLC
eukprot:5799603-Karenia_brevis.AAC.1